MKNFASRLLLLFFLLVPVAASAQSTGKVVTDCTTGVPLAYTVGSTSMMTMLADGRACVSAAVSASITGFPGTTQTTGTPISVTTGGVTGTLPSGAVVVASNVGTTNNAYCKLGASATTSDQLIAPNSWFAFTVGSNTQLTCITSTSTTTVNMVGGSGLPTGTGGGGGGGGGLSVTDQAAWTQASSAFTPGGGVFNDSATLTSGQQGTFRMTTKRAQIVDVDTSGNALYTALTASVPAGTNLIGDVNLRQGGTALSITNGAYFNQLQGNAVLSATNPSFTRLTDATNAQVLNPCQVVAVSYKAFSQTATAVLVSGTSAKKTYVCSISIIAGAAEIFNLTAGTGSTCGTNTVAVIGSTTAANGLSLAANGGLTFGNGAASIAATTVNADDLCLQQSGSNRLSGSITYVQL